MKKKVCVRVLSMLLSLLAVMSCLVVGIISASAATYRNGAQSGPSSSYKNGRYYQNYLKVPLTGDNRTDVLAIALSQLGYQEGASNGAFSGEVSGGQNYVEFSYNMGDLGLGYGGSDYPWCASFVSWCLYQSHSTDQATYKDLGRNHIGDYKYIWKEISCSQWVRQLKGAGYYKYSAYEGGSYTPKYGDLVFFQNSKGVAHIGICLYTSGGRIYTVEGNTSDSSGLEANGGGVYFKNYSLSTSYINGYGVLPYKSNSSVAKIDYSGANPTTGLYVANASKYIYSTEDATSYSYIIPRFSVFEITKIGTNGTRLYGTFKTTTGATVNGWISNNSDRIIQLSSSAPSVSAEELARENLTKTVASAKTVRHYNYTEAKISEIRNAYNTAVSLLNNTNATAEAMNSANSTLSALIKQTGSNTTAFNNEGVYVSGRNSYIKSGDCFIYSDKWNSGLITIDNANIRYTVNVVVRWDETLGCNVVKSVSEGTGSSTPSVQLSEGEWLIAAHDWESGVSDSDNPVEYSSTNYQILKNLKAGDRVYVSGCTVLDAGTDVEPAAYIKFADAESVIMTGKNTKAEKGDFVLFAPDFNNGVITAENANIHKTLNIIAQWDDPKGAWIVAEKFMGNGKEDGSATIEISDGRVVISGYMDAEETGGVQNLARLDSARIGDRVVFSGITPSYGVNTVSISANIDFVKYTEDTSEDDTEQAEPENLAISKSYDVIANTNGYDANLTDGVYATALDYTKKNQWFGFNKYSNSSGGAGQVTIDLGGVYSLTSFRMHLSHDDFDASVAQPGYVEVAVSDNGTDFSIIGNLAVNATASKSYWAGLDADSTVTGRYVRFYVYNDIDNHTWNMLNEIEVYGTEVKGEPNVALGAQQIVNPARDNYNTSLTDGIADVNLGADKWFGFLADSEDESANTENGTGSVVVDLGARYSINSVNAHFFSGENEEGAVAPSSASVYVSIDGETYAKAGQLSFTDTGVPFWAELTDAGAVGRYVKIQVETQGRWTLLNEVEVYGKAHVYTQDNNIALEKSYASPGFSGSSFTANLTDGAVSSIFQYGVNNSSWFAFKNTGDVTTGNTTGDRGIVTLDLGGQAEIEGTQVHIFAGDNDAGATQPAYMNVYISDDGETFDYIGYVNTDPNVSGAYWLELGLETPVYARYIKYAFGGIDSGELVLLNEIKVSGTMLSSNEADEPGSMSSVVLSGDFNDWTATPNMMRAEGSAVSYSLELDAGLYQFKILDGVAWFGNNGTIENTTNKTSDTGWEMTEDAANCTLNATGGVYTFLYDTQTRMLKVMHTADTFYLRGTFNDWGTGDVLTENEDGTFSKTLTLTAGTYEYKAANEDYSKQWPEFNQSITLERKTDVTFTLNIFTNELTVTQEINDFIVKFVDFNGTVLSTQIIRKGEGAAAPEDPVRKDYRFTGWDKNFDNITADTTIKAKYIQTHGELKVDMAGGAGFMIALGDGAPRPQGTAYHNSRIQMGMKITLTAINTTDEEFMGWVNADNGSIVCEELTYTFVTSGKDNLKAVFNLPLEGVNVVVFKNGKQNKILDMQYYAEGDEIVFPADPQTTGFDFDGWDHTSDEIQSKLSRGEDVTILAKWTVKPVYLSLSVNGGEVTEFVEKDEQGKYLAYRAVTVEANAVSEGMKFAFWMDENGKVKSYDSTYKFYIAKDTALTAVYVKEDADVDFEVLVDAIMDTAHDKTSNNIIFSWCVPEEETGYTFVKAGILLTSESNYNELTFEVGTDDLNVTQYSPKTQYQIANNSYSVIKTGVNAGDTWVVRAWVQYLDANGQLCVAYSDIVFGTKL